MSMLKIREYGGSLPVAHGDEIYPIEELDMAVLRRH